MSYNTYLTILLVIYLSIGLASHWWLPIALSRFDSIMGLGSNDESDMWIFRVGWPIVVATMAVALLVSAVLWVLDQL